MEMKGGFVPHTITESATVRWLSTMIGWSPVRIATIISHPNTTWLPGEVTLKYEKKRASCWRVGQCNGMHYWWGTEPHRHTHLEYRQFTCNWLSRRSHTRFKNNVLVEMERLVPTRFGTDWLINLWKCTGFFQIAKILNTCRYNYWN